MVYLTERNRPQPSLDVDRSHGMAVTVEVKTGYRRIIDYIFSPLVEVASTAMKER